MVDVLVAVVEVITDVVVVVKVVTYVVVVTVVTGAVVAMVVTDVVIVVVAAVVVVVEETSDDIVVVLVLNHSIERLKYRSKSVITSNRTQVHLRYQRFSDGLSYTSYTRRAIMSALKTRLL